MDKLSEGDTVVMVNPYRVNHVRDIKIVRVSRTYYTLANGHKILINGDPALPRHVAGNRYDHTYYLTRDAYDAARRRQSDIAFVRSLRLTDDECVALAPVMRAMRGDADT